MAENNYVSPQDLSIGQRFARTELELVPGGPEIPGQDVALLVTVSVKEFEYFRYPEWSWPAEITVVKTLTPKELAPLKIEALNAFKIILDAFVNDRHEQLALTLATGGEPLAPIGSEMLPQNRTSG